jgi:predicted DNA-binding transcriptional regulator YafY
MGQRLSPANSFRYAQGFSKHVLQLMGRTMSEQAPLLRQWILLKALSSRRYGATVQELAEDVGVSLKTIRRDLKTFQAAGFPLEETVEDFGRKKWRLDPAKSQVGLSFAFDEAIALYLGRRFLEPLAGTVFWDASQRAFKKIRATLGKNALRYMDKFAGMFHQTMLGTHDYSQKAEILDELVRGIEDHLAVFITYQSMQATEPVTYDIYPYGLIYHRGSLYLVGHSLQRDEVCHWKIDRVEAAEATEVHFNWPDGFDLREHLRRSFGVYGGTGDVRVKVRFAPSVARYVQESHWHESQKLSPQKDGSLVAQFRLSDTEEIKRWIMSFGAHAVVLEPASLCQEIRDELRTLEALYDQQDGQVGKTRSVGMKQSRSLR